MDNNKLIFAKLLGEIYRTQKRLEENSCSVGDDVIYGLLNGVERVINEELGELSFVSESAERIVIEVLNEYFTDKTKLQNLKGFYDIEPKLEANGVNRWTAIKVLTLLQAEGRFTNVISKFDTSSSPGECRTFKIPDWSK